MAKAEKLPSGSWRCRAYDPRTKKQKSFTAPTKREAERMAREYALAAAVPDEPGSVTVGRAVADYIEGRTNVLSPNTLKDYRTSERLHIAPLKDTMVSELTDTAVQAWLNRLADGHSPKTVRNVYGLLGAAVAAAMPGRRFRVSLPKKERKEECLPTEEDVREILEDAPEPLRTAIQLAVCCCMRRGEIAALREEDVHDTYISVRHSMVQIDGKWEMKSPKTYTSSRDVPCPSFLIAKLRKALPGLNPTEISGRWERYKNRHGYGFRFHDFRHFSASLMLTVMPKVDCERFGGWEHGSGVLDRVYTYNIREQLGESAARWLERMESLTGDEKGAPEPQSHKVADAPSEALLSK